MKKFSKGFSLRLGDVKVRKSTPSHLRGTRVHDAKNEEDRRQARMIERKALQDYQDEMGPDL